MSSDLKLPGWPVYAEDEISAMTDVMRSGRVNFWTGDEVRQFESEYADYVGTQRAIALANGSMALDLALKTLEIGAGDEVVVTPYSFIASASCVALTGATPVFADIDPKSLNITAESIAAVLGPETKAVIVVHIQGCPCEMDEIVALCKSRGIYLIEDCAQAHGARYRDMPVGSFGDMAAFSFCQDKIISTAGEGGMLLLNDEAWWQRAWSYKDHGKSFDQVHRLDHPVGFRWLHESFGTNWRMTELQAVVGRKQLEKLNDWIIIRRRNAAILNDAFADCALIETAEVPPHIYHACYKYTTQIHAARLRKGWTRDRLVAEISEKGVPCFTGTCAEIYKEQAFVKAGYGNLVLPNAQRCGDRTIQFLVHPTLDEDHMMQIAGIARDVFLEALA